MTSRFLFHEAAREDLREARDWYDAQRAGLGAEFGHGIGAVLERIASYPDAFPEILPGVRRAVLARFPYSVFYRKHDHALEILAVFHHRRDPTVWRGRAAV